MKRILPFLSVLLLVPALLVVPALGAELAGGYYITGDSALGNDLTFYVPADYASGSLTYDSSGNLFNLTSSNVYLYCPDFPDYTIYAPRFSVFQYRTDGGYGSTYVDLNLSDVSHTNVEILEDSPSMVISSDMLLMCVLAVLVMGLAVFVIYPRR